MKVKKIIATVLCIAVLCSMSAFPSFAEEVPAPYSYRDELLVSYSEFWYIDGYGVESHVEYDQKHIAYTFLNGYRVASRVVTPLPLDTPGFPQGMVTRAQHVELRYEFY